MASDPEDSAPTRAELAEEISQLKQLCMALAAQHIRATIRQGVVEEVLEALAAPGAPSRPEHDRLPAQIDRLARERSLEQLARLEDENPALAAEFSRLMRPEDEMPPWG